MHDTDRRFVDDRLRDTHVFARRSVVAISVAFIVMALALGTLAATVSTQFSSKDARLNSQSGVIALAISDIVKDCAIITGLGGRCPDYVPQLRRLDPLLGQ